MTVARCESPYFAHVFVCTNDRGGVRKSCADNDSALVKTRLKEAVNERGWQGKVRVSTSGCMGLCTQGANVMIYPLNIWLSAVTPEQVDSIVTLLEELLAAHARG
nr:(2Fe-2S) ferredoxin domain-containing protein [uncultured Desulfobulbus sp.]